MIASVLFDLVALFLGVVAYLGFGLAICLVIIFVSLKVEAWVRGRVAFAQPGPEKASAQERRAAAELGYLRRGHD